MVYAKENVGFEYISPLSLQNLPKAQNKLLQVGGDESSPTRTHSEGDFPPCVKIDLFYKRMHGYSLKLKKKKSISIYTRMTTLIRGKGCFSIACKVEFVRIGT